MYLRIVLIIGVVGFFVAAGAAGDDDAESGAGERLSAEQLASYSMGVQFGRRLRGLGPDVDLEMVSRGIEDVVGSKTLLISEEEIDVRSYEWYQEAQKRQMEAHRRLMETNMAEQEAFLAENKAVEGITTLESGLQYKVIRPGTGDRPELTDLVRMRYTGRLLDGTVFETSERHGVEDGNMEILVNKAVMAGMREALLLMQEGAKWELYVPSELGYGRQPRPNVGPNQLLVIELELLEILPPDPDSPFFQPQF